MMRYRIKGFLINGSAIDCRFECVLSNFDEVVEFLSRVSLDNYDVVKVLPEDFKEN